MAILLLIQGRHFLLSVLSAELRSVAVIATSFAHFPYKPQAHLDIIFLMISCIYFILLFFYSRLDDFYLDFRGFDSKVGGLNGNVPSLKSWESENKRFFLEWPLCPHAQELRPK